MNQLSMSYPKAAFMPNGHQIYSNYQMFQFVGKAKDLKIALRKMLSDWENGK